MMDVARMFANPMELAKAITFEDIVMTSNIVYIYIYIYSMGMCSEENYVL
jgi:hypothetical protein